MKVLGYGTKAGNGLQSRVPDNGIYRALIVSLNCLTC